MNELVEEVIGQTILDENDCWLWAGRTTSGYGYISRGGKSFRVHRITYEHFRGAIPEGLQIDHLCRVRACSNPWHLEVVTARENTLRGQGVTALNSRKTHCSNGHEFTPENTKIKTGRGFHERMCRECHRAWCRQRYYASKQRATPRPRSEPPQTDSGGDR